MSVCSVPPLTRRAIVRPVVIALPPESNTVPDIVRSGPLEDELLDDEELLEVELVDVVLEELLELELLLEDEELGKMVSVLTRPDRVVARPNEGQPLRV